MRACSPVFIVKFYQDTATPICLHITYGCFQVTVAKQSSTYVTLSIAECTLELIGFRTGGYRVNKQTRCLDRILCYSQSRPLLQEGVMALHGTSCGHGAWTSQGGGL